MGKGKRDTTQEPPVSLTLRLGEMGPEGDCAASYDGDTVTVSYGIPGELVIAEVRKRKSGRLEGEVVRALEPSPYRVTSRCPYYQACGGCQWQHISYERQLALKGQLVRQALEAAGFHNPPAAETIPSPQPWHYRNHARFTVRRGGRLGFVNRHSRRFVPIDYCHLMHPWINHALAVLQGRCAETTQLSIRYGVNTGAWLLQPALLSPDVSMASGQGHYEEELCGRRFRIASPSFFQVNTAQAERLLHVVREELGLTGQETIVDAYAGVGTFAVALAPYAAKVIAIEESTSAVQDAAANAKDIANIRFVEGKTELALRDVTDRIDAVVLDPPRVGCQPAALQTLLALAIPRIVYVSCDPRALARDLKVLCVNGAYSLRSIQPLDLFPQTYHVECVATLDWQGVAGQPPIILASASPRRSELLSLLDVPFAVRATNVSEDEVPHGSESFEQLAERLALTKARAGARGTSGLVIGGDTLVIIDGRSLGKPRDLAEARRMLRQLRGRMHRVITGVAVVDQATGNHYLAHRTTTVTMRAYTDAEIEEYLATGDSLDKAGGYAIQAPRFKPVERLDGCYTNVVGLPLCELVEPLRRAGLPFTPPRPERLPDECRSPVTFCPLLQRPLA
ncbi:MAG: septum formation protein Maf [Chloroflexi bacterium]|nr:septum formation protein Maf [Chloroflexota bacterium]